VKILLVEDNLMNQKVVIFNLKRLNCEITPVGNGKMALEAYLSNTHDLILMDIMLPEMNGYEITAEIRKHEKENKVEKPVPIVALTANTYDNDKEKCFKVGMNDYLAKPFTAQQLVEMVQKYLKIE